MDKWLRTFRGSCHIQVSGVAKEQALNRLTKARLRFWGLEHMDDFTWRLWILSADIKQVTTILERSQSTWQVVERTGGLWLLRGFQKRKLFLFFLIFALVSVYFSSEYIVFIKVEGNETVSTATILEELENFGLTLGTSTADLNPHDLKFKTLTRIPQLEWLTVTTNGCVATVTVRERRESQYLVDRKTTTNIVAKEAALVTDISVLSGVAACAKGDIVTKGQLLISGYGDLETSVVSMAALGEVYGRTWRRLDLVMPAVFTQKQEKIATETSYGIIFGRKRINFSKNSGNVGVECDKMVDIEPLTLPGGYTLPIYWVTETVTTWNLEPVAVSQMVATSVLMEQGENLVRQELVAGQMEKQTVCVTKQGDLYHLNGIYQCHEMIGTTVPGLQFEDG